MHEVWGVMRGGRAEGEEEEERRGSIYHGPWGAVLGG